MIILDTNVISALMRRRPDPPVRDWLDRQPGESVWTTSITVLEVRTGLESLDPGDRRMALEQAFDALLRSDLEERILAFDVPAANAAGAIAGARRRAGRTIEVRDIQIAGIAMVRHAILATRNTRHFEGLGLPLVDPWDERAPPTHGSSASGSPGRSS